MRKLVCALLYALALGATVNAQSIVNRAVRLRLFVSDPTELPCSAGYIKQTAAGAVYTGANGSYAVISGGGAVDVVGPASATDNAMVRFDGTTS